MTLDEVISMTLLLGGRSLVLAGAGVTDDRESTLDDAEARPLPPSGLKERDETGRRRAELTLDGLAAEEELPESDPLVGLESRSRDVYQHSAYDGE